MYDAWNDPKTLSIVSDIAGIELIPMIDYDIGNFNISVQDEGQGKAKVANQSDDDIPITNWHHDSYPFVCVVMMSDASKMVGGETALRNGAGEIIKVRGPQMVSNLRSLFPYRINLNPLLLPWSSTVNMAGTS